MGRAADCQSLDDLWKLADCPAVVAITGIPGVGKTELAIQYGRSCLKLDDYRGGVAWFAAAEFGETLRDWMQATFCPDRDLRHLSALEQQVAYGWSEWQNYCGLQRFALVIIDDVTDYHQQVAPYLPKVESERSPFRFLLTARSHFGGRIPTRELRELDSNSALTMLSRFAGVEWTATESDLAKALCNRLGYLPLAIALAGSWLRIDADRTLTELIASLEHHGLDAPVLERDPQTIRLTAERGLKAAFAVSWARLAELNPSAQQLARVLSLFAAADLPWKLLVEAIVQQYAKGDAQPQLKPPQRSRSGQQHWLQKIWQRVWRGLCRLLGQQPRSQPTLPTRTPILDLVEAKGSLLQLSLMQRVDDNGQTYRLHPLLRQFFAEQWQGADQEGWETALIRVVSDCARSIPANLSWEQAVAFDWLRPHLAPVQQILQDRVATVPDSQTATRYRQQVRNIRVAIFHLDYISKAEATFVQAYKLHNQARLHVTHGGMSSQQVRQLFAAALEDYQKAIDLARKAFPADSWQLAGYLHQLATLLRHINHHNDAIPLAEEAVRIASTKASSVKLANYLEHLAELLFFSHNSEKHKIEPLLLRSLQIREDHLGANHLDTALSLYNLAMMVYGHQEPDKAESLYLQALQICKRQLGAGHPNTATVLFMLAGFYMVREQQDKFTSVWNQFELLSDQTKQQIFSHNMGFSYDDKSE